MIETAYKVSPAHSTVSKSKTVTIRPSSLKTASSTKSQQIIVIPQNMLVNGCISVDGLKKIIDNDQQTSIKTTEIRGSLKRPASAALAEDSTYGSDSEGSEHNLDKPVRKRANLDHLSSEEKLMRRKLKNRVAAQNARDKKRMKMEEMEAELMRLKVIDKPSLSSFVKLTDYCLFFLSESRQSSREKERRSSLRKPAFGG